MDTLVALGTGVAYGYSAFVTLWPGPAQSWGLPLHLYFETALIVVALVLMGRWLELKAKKRTAASIKALVGLAPTTARVLRDGTEVDVPLDQVVVGDLVRVRPGENLPVDGDVIEGALRRRRVDAHRRERAGRQAARRPGHRRHPQQHRHPGRSRRRGRRRQHAGPDRPPGRGRPGLPGPDAAPGRPGLRLVRARGPARRARDLPRLAGLRPRRPTGWPWPSARPSPCSSSPAPAPSAWPPRPRSWSAPARPPSSAS